MQTGHSNVDDGFAFVSGDAKASTSSVYPSFEEARHCINEQDDSNAERSIGHHMNR